VAGPGRDASVVLEDGRVLEYWEGGDPSGRPVIYHPGTPVSRVLGRWGHDAAVAAGVRLVAVNRPGYGDSSTPAGVPSLKAVGRDTAELARRLGFDAFAVFGGSGGGPYAVATALASSGAVRALGLVGGVGPWRVIEGPEVYPEDRACLALLDAGSFDDAWACMYGTAVAERAKLTSSEYLEMLLRGEDTPLTRSEAYRALWHENLRIVRSNLDGYTFDNIAWGGDWDVDPRDVVAPTLLWYGTADSHCSVDGHGRWYAQRIQGAQLIELPGAAHVQVIDGHWPEVLAGLLRIWRPSTDGA
jgi:pimeloyl-ACP methyl ester carboxylesterase